MALQIAEGVVEKRLLDPISWKRNVNTLVADEEQQKRRDKFEKAWETFNEKRTREAQIDSTKAGTGPQVTTVPPVWD